MTRPRRTRAEFLATASDLADAIGLDELTLTRVAQAAGITTPGAYKHVADIADLRRQIAQQTLRDVTELVLAAAAGRRDGDAIAAVGQSMIAWARKHPGRYASLQTAPDPTDAEHAALGAALVDAIATTLRSYRLSDDDTVDAVRMLRSLLHGYIMLDLAGSFRLGREVDASFERSLRAIDGVLRSWATAP